MDTLRAVRHPHQAATETGCHPAVRLVRGPGLTAAILVVGVALAAAVAPRLLAQTFPDQADAARIAAGIIFAASYLGLAIGKVPGLSIDRAGVALIGACLMVASGALSLQDAARAIDFDTIILLLGMMIVVASLRLSGFFAVATAWAVPRAGKPFLLLCAIAAISGLFSAFLVNDAICLVLAPLVLDLTLRTGRNPRPTCWRWRWRRTWDRPPPSPAILRTS